MTEEELMIGDLVQVNDEVCKVISISYFDIGISDSKEDFYNEHIDNIKPIPLTTEILEKNFDSEKVDFEGRHISTRYTDRNEFRDIVIAEYTDGMWEVKIDDVDFSDPPTWKVYVCDVHELQHALRLCSINKEIKL
jgi:hypothetical protein